MNANIWPLKQKYNASLSKRSLQLELSFNDTVGIGNIKMVIKLQSCLLWKNYHIPEVYKEDE